MNPAYKRFVTKYADVADAIARLDIDQEDREAVARAVGDALAEDARAHPDFQGYHATFVLLASDPLVPCAGPRESDEGCPHGRVIRIGMHLSSAPDGRSHAWERRAPYGKIRCISCGIPTTRREVA